MRVLLLSMPDRHPYFGKREYEAPSLGISSIGGNLDRRHQVWIAATTMYRELADSPEAEVLDFIYRGEADHGCDELLDALEGRRAMESVAGLSWKHDGTFVHNADRPIEDLSTIALPDRDRRVYQLYHYYFHKADVMDLKLPVQFLVQASCAGIAKDPALPKKMTAAGVTMVFLGVENASETNLQQMKKGKIVGVTRTAVERLADAGIIVVGGLINGLPDDDVASMRRNYEFFVSLGINLVLDQLITPYPGTEMRRELIEAGLVTNPHDFQWYNGNWPQVRTKHLDSKQLLWEKWKARRDIVEDWRPNAQVKEYYPYCAMLDNGIVRPIIRFNEHRMDLMYGVKGRYKRQMMQWARINDYFGDMVIDEPFFDPDVEGPEGMGNPAVSLDFGQPPYKDTNDEPSFVRTVAGGHVST